MGCGGAVMSSRVGVVGVSGIVGVVDNKSVFMLLLSEVFRILFES